MIYLLLVGTYTLKQKAARPILPLEELLFQHQGSGFLERAF